MTKEIVISSYKEDTSWISNINQDVKIYLYNKDNKSNTINLPNIGREAHTYLYHIVTNYNNLSDYIFFFQGPPFDHTGDCINIVNSDRNYWDKKSQMKYNGYWGYAHNSLGTMWKLDKCEFFEGNCLKSSIDGKPHHFGLPIKEVWNQIFDIDIPGILEFIPGNQFHINKQLIHNKPLSFWQNLYNMSQIIELFPWVFERLTPYIFNSKITIK